MGLLGWFSGKSSGIEKSFTKVKEDMKLVFSWIHYLNQKHLHNYEDIEKIKNELDALTKKIAKLEGKNVPNEEVRMEKTNLVRTKSGPKNEPGAKGRLEKKILAKIRPKKKEYVMHQIVEMIERESLSTKEVEVSIVKEKGLCGRTAFYDYLREMKNTGRIKATQKNSKKILEVVN